MRAVAAGVGMFGGDAFGAAGAMLGSFAALPPDEMSELSCATTTFMPPGAVAEVARGATDAVAPSAGAGGAKPDVQTSPISPAAARRSSEKSPSQELWPYRTNSEVSAASDWRLHYWQASGQGLALARGLRNQDLRLTTHCSPGVCVLRSDGLPQIRKTNPAVEAKERVIAATAAALRDLGVPDAHAHHQGSPLKTGGREAGGVRRAASEVSLSSSVHSAHQRRQNLPAVVARTRYQTFVTSGGTLKSSPVRRSRRTDDGTSNN